MEDNRTSTWRRSTRCGTNACVEVAKVPGGYLVRDAKNPQGSVLTFGDAAWVAFLEGAKAGEFDN